MQRADMDRMVDEHFRFEAEDDVEGVLATLTDDARHHLVGSPWGELAGKAAIREFYTALFADLIGDSVQSIARRYGNDMVVDESRWSGTVRDGRLFGFPGRAGHATFVLLHVLELRDGLIVREQVWPDAVALARELT